MLCRFLSDRIDVSVRHVWSDLILWNSKLLVFFFFYKRLRFIGVHNKYYIENYNTKSWFKELSNKLPSLSLSQIIILTHFIMQLQSHLNKTLNKGSVIRINAEAIMASEPVRLVIRADDTDKHTWHRSLMQIYCSQSTLTTQRATWLE